jgi:hypothetical protein
MITLISHTIWLDKQKQKIVVFSYLCKALFELFLDIPSLAEVGMTQT